MEKQSDSEIRVGILGLDTSHVTAFSELLNGSENDVSMAGVRVVAGYPGHNPDFPLSYERVDEYTEQLRALGVQIVDSIEQLLDVSDVVMLESVDGRQHLEQVKPIFAAGKPVFIDKPLAASLQDAVEIYRLGKESGTPWFTASSSRFTPGYLELRESDTIGQVLGCDTYAQSRVAPGHPDLYWYGVHGVELLHAILGQGCESVSAAQTEYTESIRGIWNDGRVGNYRSIREETGKAGLGATVFGKEGIAHHNRFYDYKSLVVKIVRFFKTKELPVTQEESLEVFAFLEAAEESKRQGGQTVRLKDVLATAGFSTIG